MFPALSTETQLIFSFKEASHGWKRDKKGFFLNEIKQHIGNQIEFIEIQLH